MYPCVCGIGNGAKWIHRLEVSIAQVAEHRAVHFVCAGAGNDVHYTARSPAILSRVAVGLDLELLHSFLRNRGTDAVGGIVYCVRAVHVHQVGARPLSAHVQSGSGSSSDRRSVVASQARVGESKVNVVAAIDRKIVDAALFDGIGGRTALRLNLFGSGTHRDGFLGAGNSQCDWQVRQLSHRDGLGGGVFRKTGGLNHY